MALAWLVFLRPVSLGGPADYVVVSGRSMEPTLHAGDLAVIRKQGGYAAGDVVAFRVPEGEPGAGGRVIHRIIGGSSEEGFVVQGDNKNAPDLWRPKPKDILGKMWLRIPSGGRVVTVLRSPMVLAALAASVAVFVVLGSGEKGKGRRGQRGAPPG